MEFYSTRHWALVSHLQRLSWLLPHPERLRQQALSLTSATGMLSIASASLSSVFCLLPSAFCLLLLCPIP
ncbi:hypothetical protein VNO78_22478 [Psophocarpus tetragonolobus]|uniref:Uncharacterized protein n=1 Tax=Psophocarpus tetragonolobus TaxID=3891 RepID=A0AAN9XBJ1_PSOTE